VLSSAVSFEPSTRSWGKIKARSFFNPSPEEPETSSEFSGEKRRRRRVYRQRFAGAIISTAIAPASLSRVIRDGVLPPEALAVRLDLKKVLDRVNLSYCAENYFKYTMF